MHSQPIPRLGGVAIFISTALAVGLVLAGQWIIAGKRPAMPLGTLLPGVLLGATIVFLTGLLDDIRSVAPRLKLLAQTAAALAVVAYGFPAENFALAPGGSVVHLGWFAAPLAVLWIVGVTNAFNLIDGVDGLAGTFALIGLATCIAADFMFAGQSVLSITLAMAGAVFAFLRYNQSPARIFLGDSGSMTLGFFLAVRSVVSATGPDGKTIYFLIPLVALAFPIADTFIAIARRWLRGHHISRADGRHVHHQLLALGLSAPRTVELLGFVFSAFAVVGLSVVFAPPKFTLALLGGASILGFALFLYGVRFLKYSEFVQFGASIASVIRSARSVVRDKVLIEELARNIERAKSLSEIMLALDTYSEITGIIQVELVAGRPSFIGPEGQMIAPPNALPWRLDYRMGLGDDARREYLLRIWCGQHKPGVAHGCAERFAMQVGPAIERWMQENLHLFVPGERQPGQLERTSRSAGDTPSPRPK